MAKLSERVQRIAPSMTLRITAMANELRAAGEDVIGLAAGEPDFNTPQHICDAAVTALNNGCTKYTPASGTLELKRAVCVRQKAAHGICYEPSQVVCSNGAKHSLFNACMAVIDPGDEVLLPSPYWLTYPELIMMAEGVPVIVRADESTGFKPTAEALRAACTDRTKAIILNNPSNPTGAVYTKRELEEIAELAREKDIFIISDEIYDSLVYGDAKFTAIAGLSPDAYERTIVVCGMSKSYAMTGWRIGFTLSAPELAKAMGSYQSHAASNPCSIAQYASVEGLAGSQESVEEMRRAFEKRRDLMCELLSGIDGIAETRPDGAFYVFINIAGVLGKRSGDRVINGSIAFAEELMKAAKVAVIPGAPFGSDDHIRLSFATGDDKIREGVARIASFVASLK